MKIKLMEEIVFRVGKLVEKYTEYSHKLSEMKEYCQTIKKELSQYEKKENPNNDSGSDFKNTLRIELVGLIGNEFKCRIYELEKKDIKKILKFVNNLLKKKIEKLEKEQQKIYKKLSKVKI